MYAWYGAMVWHNGMAQWYGNDNGVAQWYDNSNGMAQDMVWHQDVVGWQAGGMVSWYIWHVCSF